MWWLTNSHFTKNYKQVILSVKSPYRFCPFKNLVLHRLCSDVLLSGSRRNAQLLFKRKIQKFLEILWAKVINFGYEQPSIVSLWHFCVFRKVAHESFAFYASKYISRLCLLCSLKSHIVHSYYTTKKNCFMLGVLQNPLFSSSYIFLERGDVSNFFYLKYWDTKHTFKVLLYIAHKIFWIYWTIAGPKNLTNFQYTKFKTDLTSYLLQILIMLCEYIKRIFYAKMPQKLCVWDLLSEFPLEVKCRYPLSVNYYLKRCCYVII